MTWQVKGIATDRWQADVRQFYRNKSINPECGWYDLAKS
jgi:hypothetical protein